MPFEHLKVPEEKKGEERYSCSLLVDIPTAPLSGKKAPQRFFGGGL